MQYNNYNKVDKILKAVPSENSLNELISALSQIQAELSQPGGTLRYEEIVATHAGSQQAQVMSLIAAIGLMTFIRTDFSETSQSLREHWLTYAATEDSQEEALQVAPQPQEEAPGSPEVVPGRVSGENVEEPEEEDQPEPEALPEANEESLGEEQEELEVPPAEDREEAISDVEMEKNSVSVTFKFESHPILQGLDLYILDENNLPAVNWEDYEQLIKNFQNTIFEIERDLSEKFFSNTLKGPDKSSYIVEVNKLMFAIKQNDEKISDLFEKAYQNIIDKSLDTLFNEDADILNYFNATSKDKLSIIREREVDFYNRAIITMITNNADENPELVSRLFKIILLLTNYSLSKMITKNDYNVPQLHPYKEFLGQNEDKIPRLIEVTERKSFSSFKNLLRRTTPLGYKNVLRNFVGRHALAGMIITSAYNLVFKENDLKIKYVKCSVCFKKIPKSDQSSSFYKFSIPLYSIFMKPGRQAVTYEEIKDIKFPPPEPKIFKGSENSVDYEYVKQIKGSATWDSIKKLIYSNNLIDQREGWYRRAGAIYHLMNMKDMSGRYIFRDPSLSDKDLTISSQTIQLKNIMFGCPSDTTDESGCGLSGSVVDGKAIQPSWSGSFKGIPAEIETDDEDLKSEAERLKSSSFKFSAHTFSCPCEIKPTHASNEILSKRPTIGIRLSGPYSSEQKNHSALPTNPDGSFADVTGKSGYLLCSTETSLSSYDRVRVIPYLKKLKNTTVTVSKSTASTLGGELVEENGYVYLIEKLIRFGLSIEDVMYFEKTLSQSKEVEEDFSKKSVERIDKLFKIIKKAAVNVTKDETFNKLLRDFPLVCPFGHKFVIGQSLDVAKTHSGMVLSTKNNAIYYKKFFTDMLFNEDADINLKYLISKKFLVPVETVSNALVPAENRFQYEEWIKFPEKAYFDRRKKRDPEHIGKFRSLSFSTNRDENQNRAVLIFKYNDHDYIAKFNTSAIRDNVWDYQSSSRQRITDIESAGKRYQEVASEYTDNEGKVVSLIDRAGESEAAEEEFPVEEIPVSGEASLESKSESLGRAVKSIIRLINSSLEQLDISFKNDNFSPFVKYQDASQVEKIGKNIFSLMVPYIETMYDENGDIIKEENKNSALQNAQSLFLKMFVDRIKNFGVYIIEKKKDLNQLAATKKIFINIILDIFLESQDYFDFSISEVEFETVVKKWINNNRIEARNLMYLSKSKKDIDLKLAKVFYASYAYYLADALASISNKFFYDPSGDDYIGYDIGLDLSDSKKIIGSFDNDIWSPGLNESDLDRVTESIRGQDIDMISAQKYELNIDKCWVEIRKAIERGKKASSSPGYIAKAKEIIVNIIMSKPGDDDGYSREKAAKYFLNSFPIRTLNFRDTKSAGLDEYIPVFGSNVSTYNMFSASGTRKGSENYIISDKIATTLSDIFSLEKIMKIFNDGDTDPKRDAVVGDIVFDILNNALKMYEGFETQTFSSFEEKNSFIKEQTSKEFIAKDIEILESIINYLMNKREELQNIHDTILRTPRTRGDDLKTKIIKKRAIRRVLDKFDTFKIIEKLVKDIEGGLLISLSTMPRNKKINEKSSDVLVNDQYNYNSGRIQIGFYGGKGSKSVKGKKDQLETLTWPPPERGYLSKQKVGHVKIPLPFRNPGKSTASAASYSILNTLQIVDSRIIVAIDGIPVDISPLLVRGRNFDETTEVQRIEKEIENIERNKDFNLQRARRQGLEDVEVEKIRSLYDNQINSKIRIINGFGLSVSVGSILVKKRYVNQGGISHPALTLEDPVRCYKIINNKNLRGVEYSEQERKLLLDFIYDVYRLDIVRSGIIELLESSIKNMKANIYKVEDIKAEQEKLVKLKANKYFIFEIYSLPSYKTRRNKVVSINTILEEKLKDAPGNYFDVVPYNRDDNSGTYISYICDRLLPSTTKLMIEDYDRIPDLSELRKDLQNFSTSGFIASHEKGGRSLHKMHQIIEEYIIRSTKGDDFLASQRNVEASEYYDRINSRLKKLAGIINLVRIPFPI